MTIHISISFFGAKMNISIKVMYLDVLDNQLKTNVSNQAEFTKTLAAMRMILPVNISKKGFDPNVPIFNDLIPKTDRFT